MPKHNNEVGMRRIKIKLYLTGGTISMDELSKRIGIEPVYTSSDFPKCSNSTQFWLTEVESNALCIEEPLAGMEERIRPRLKDIVALCEEYQIEASFYIPILADYPERPEISISPRFYPLFEQLNAEVTLDVAMYPLFDEET